VRDEAKRPQVHALVRPKLWLVQYSILGSLNLSLKKTNHRSTI
jgi:hypothetical protein